MKLTAFLTSSLLLFLSPLISATTTGPDLVNQFLSNDIVYVNANGDVVIPEAFAWGRPALKEKDAAKPRQSGGGRLDASGRLGKRQAVSRRLFSFHVVFQIPEYILMITLSF